MAQNKQENQITLITGNLADWLEAFLIAKRSAGLSRRSVQFYTEGLTNFFNYVSPTTNDIQEISVMMIRKYLLHLEDIGLTPGGVHAKYRCIRAFFNWYEYEEYPENWFNPMRKVKMKKPRQEPLEPADINAVRAMIADCSVALNKSDCKFLGVRDKAILLTLLDTGLRASELLSLTPANINPVTGVIQLVHGKGGKSRTVYIGRKARQAMRRYLREANPENFLWVNISGEPLTRSGLRQMLQERAKRAGVAYQTAHSFRRLFAISMLRAGVDIYSLQLLMGHADIQVLRRYLKLTDQDTLAAHIKGSPVDKLV